MYSHNEFHLLHNRAHTIPNSNFNFIKKEQFASAVAVEYYSNRQVRINGYVSASFCGV